MNDTDLSPLALWEQQHREATKVLSDFAKSGDVDWEQVLSEQRALLDDLLTEQDRRISRRRPMRRVPKG